MAKAARQAEPEFDLSKLDSVSTGTPTKGKNGGKVVDNLTIRELAPYAAIDYVGKQIESLMKGIIGSPIRERTFEYFVTKGPELGKCPDNPKGVDGDNIAEASLQMRRKTSHLDEETVAEFEAIDVPLEKVVLAPHTLRVKPEVFEADPKIVNKIIAACDAAGLPWTEIFEFQQPNIKMCVADNTLSTLFVRARDYAKSVAEGNPNNYGLTCDRVKELLMKAATPSIRPTYRGSLPDALVVLAQQLNMPLREIEEAFKLAEEVAAAKAETAPDTKPTPAKSRKG